MQADDGIRSLVRSRGLGAVYKGQVKLLRKMGADIVAACFVIDLPDLGGRKKLEDLGVTVRTLISYEGH